MLRREVIGGCELYLADWRDVAPRLGNVDLVLTDPPYGTGVVSKGGLKSRVAREYDPKVRAHVWPEIFGDDGPFDPAPLLSVSNNIILWGANNFASRLPDSACWLSWDKKCGRAAESKIGDCELAWVRGLPFRTVRAFRHMWAGFQRDSEVGDRHLHPTQKPIALMAWCLQFFPAAKVVLDPFMGVGATGIACVKLGRRFIGVEIDPTYFNVACTRIEQEHRQGKLFAEMSV